MLKCSSCIVIFMPTLTNKWWLMRSFAVVVVTNIWRRVSSRLIFSLFLIFLSSNSIAKVFYYKQFDATNRPLEMKSLIWLIVLISGLNGKGGNKGGKRVRNVNCMRRCNINYKFFLYFKSHVYKVVENNKLLYNTYLYLLY